jgi:hypothetical protein
MFGQPDWFAGKGFGCCLRPACWKGWIYTLVWFLVTLVPTVALLMVRGPVEALIWLIAASVVWCWDARQIRHVTAEVKPPEDDVLYIDDDGQSDSVTTRNYELRLKQ